MATQSSGLTLAEKRRLRILENGSNRLDKIIGQQNSYLQDPVPVVEKASVAALITGDNVPSNGRVSEPSVILTTSDDVVALSKSFTNPSGFNPNHAISPDDSNISTNVRKTPPKVSIKNTSSVFGILSALWSIITNPVLGGILMSILSKLTGSNTQSAKTDSEKMQFYSWRRHMLFSIFFALAVSIYFFITAWPVPLPIDILAVIHRLVIADQSAIRLYSIFELGLISKSFLSLSSHTYAVARVYSSILEAVDAMALFLITFVGVGLWLPLSLLQTIE